MFGELDGKSPDAAGTGLNEDFLAGLHLAHLDQCLPRGQPHQRDGRRVRHVEVFGLQRHVGFIDGDEFSECADAVIARPREDLVPYLKAHDLGPSLDNCSGDVVPQNEGRTVGQNKLELSIPDLGVKEVHSRGVNLDQDIIVLPFRFWNAGEAQGALLFILINDERLHRLSPISSVPRTPTHLPRAMLDCRMPALTGRAQGEAHTPRTIATTLANLQRLRLRSSQDRRQARQECAACRRRFYKGSCKTGSAQSCHSSQCAVSVTHMTWAATSG